MFGRSGGYSNGKAMLGDSNTSSASSGTATDDQHSDSGASKKNGFDKNSNREIHTEPLRQTSASVNSSGNL